MKNIHILPTDKPSRLAYYQESTSYNKPMLQIVKFESSDYKYKNICITNDEEIKIGEYGLSKLNEIIKFHSGYDYRYYAKIILTDNTDLIKDGVQAIPDEFLEWFFKNPSCEEVEVKKVEHLSNRLYRVIIPKEEPKTAWVGVLHDKLNEYHPAEYELKDIYQGEGCLPNFPDEELCQIWCDSKYKEEPNYNMKQEILAEMEKQETLEEGFYRIRKSIDYEEFDFTSFELGAKWQQQNSYSEEDMKQFGDWCRNGLLNTEYGVEKLDKHLEQWKQLTKK